MLVLVGLAATARHIILDSSALDSSESALAGATSEVVIGGADAKQDDGHEHDHGGGDGSDDVHEYWSSIPSTPSSYTVSVGDKLSFKYSAYHNVFLLPSPSAYDNCDFSGATELASQTFGGVGTAN